MFLKSRLLLQHSKLLTMNNFSSNASESIIRSTFENGIRKITMCDKKTRNSLSIGMMEALIDNISEGQSNNELRVIVLEGEGPIFSAGHNLKELAHKFGREQHEKVFNLSTKLMNVIIDSPVPIIAKVDGLAAAAGCQLVAQCDIAVCSDKSSFSTPGANFGIFCSTPGIAIARCIPKMTALYMLFTGSTITSSEAKDSGLVSKVCPAEKLDEEIQNICSSITMKSRSVIELGKRFYYKQVQEDVKKAYDLGGKLMVDNINLKDGQEGIQSFIEKRKAQWNHTFAK